MDFATWLRSRGGKVNQELDLFSVLESGDRGVVARRQIAEGELLLLLPITCALYIPTNEELAKNPAAFPPAVHYLREQHPGLSPFLATSLVLMSELARAATASSEGGAAAAGAAAGGGSEWAPYLATLPADCPDCLLYWSSEEKEELAGTAISESGPDPASDVFRRHVAPVLAARPDLWPGLTQQQQPAAAAGGKGVKAAAGGEDQGAGLRAFLRAAAMVQSRAFHLEAENWVSGAKEVVSELEGGGTQVFLLPGIDMINHSHNPVRRNARLDRLNVAQAAAAELLPGGEGAEGKEKGKGAAVEAYFVMRADKPIAAGEEVLHTYGNLSDAQLLQTYGFLDSQDDFRTTTTAAATGSSQEPAEEGKGKGKKGTKKQGKAAGKAGAAGADAGAAAGGGGYRNLYNAALVAWSAVEEVCSGLLRSMDQKPPASLQRAKRDFLAAAGVLQPAAPQDTQFVLLAREPLPDELTTAVQVLLMTKEEFQELKREYGSADAGTSAAAAAGAAGKKGQKASQAAAKSGKGGKGGAAASGSGKAEGAGAGGSGDAKLPKLSLGTALLEEDEDFAEMVCIATLQVLEASLDRYPTAAKEDVRMLRSADCTGRQRLAVRVRLGEKDVLQLAKKAVVELMRKLRDGPAAGKDKDADMEEKSDEEEEAEESEDSEEEGKKRRGGAESGGKRAAKKQRRGLGAAESEEGSGSDDEDSEDEEDEDEGEGSSDDEEDDGLLMGSDDSEKVGYGGEDFDDGIGEAHDRGKAHEAPKDD
ncbi:hypothetical protein Agub_g6597 [Astrephomene gubernaculifera]|uniref:SET domain-containing protein n=1 Tax=Astrephomene gubernaculifera TaxID=47775 RepID=A0AAD3DR67_9CHLO|nr:hypothetical protein Agub_g6597 [Astrephomene gubernaculifera]